VETTKAWWGQCFRHEQLRFAVRQRCFATGQRRPRERSALLSQGSRPRGFHGARPGTGRPEVVVERTRSSPSGLSSRNSAHVLAAFPWNGVAFT
jgi:hypothetical protein